MNVKKHTDFEKSYQKTVCIIKKIMPGLAKIYSAFNSKDKASKNKYLAYIVVFIYKV